MRYTSAFPSSHDESVWFIMSAAKAEANEEEIMACDTRIRQLSRELSLHPSSASLASKSRLEHRRTRLLHRVQLRQIMVEVERVPVVRAVVERLRRAVGQWRDARPEKKVLQEDCEQCIASVTPVQTLVYESPNDCSERYWNEIEVVAQEVLSTVDRTLSENVGFNQLTKNSTAGLSDVSTAPLLSTSISLEHVYSSGDEINIQEESLDGSTLPPLGCRVTPPPVPKECADDPVRLLIEKCKTLLSSPTLSASSSGCSSVGILPGRPSTNPVKKTSRIATDHSSKYIIHQDPSLSIACSVTATHSYRFSSTVTSFSGRVESGVFQTTVFPRPPRSPSISLPSFSSSFSSFSLPRRLTALSELFALSIIIKKLQTDACNRVGTSESTGLKRKDRKRDRKMLVLNKVEHDRLCILQKTIQQTWESLLCTCAASVGGCVSSTVSRLSDEEQYIWKEVWTRYLS